MSSIDRVRSRWLSLGVACVAGWLVASAAAPASAELRTLFEFRAPNGAEPISLVRASDGNYYGTTNKGGEYGRGAVFSINARGQIKHVYSFSGGEGGSEPSSLTVGPDGHLYGLVSIVSQDNTVYEQGVFRVTLAGRYRLLYRGPVYFARLIFAHGSLYAPSSDASIYRVRTNGQLAVLYTFSATWANQLIPGETNQLYGTTLDGGVFKLGTNGAYVSLGQLAPPSEDAPSESATSLARSSDGVLYVAAEQGSRATVYKLAADFPFGPFVSLESTASSLVAARNGVVYGTTYRGGNAEQGSVFRIAADGTVANWYAFSGGSDGASADNLVLSDDGLVGTTRYGGAGFGTVFRLRTDNQTFRTLHAFQYPRGIRPSAIVLGPDGALYGVAQSGGPNGYGTVFKATKRGVVETLYAFPGRDGAYPHTLTLAADGKLYGRTRAGGYLDRGTVFRITLSGEHERLYEFYAENQGDGPGVLVDADGTVRGADQADSGHLFYLPNWQYSGLYTFPGIQTRDSGDPNGLIRGSDGALYGTTTGAYGPLIPPNFSRGTVFRYGADGVFTTLLSLSEIEDNYALPQSLIQGSDGALYFATSNLSFLCSTYGSLQTLDPQTSTHSILHTFNGRDDGTGPVNLIQQADGSIYGLTVGGRAQTSTDDEPYVCGSRNATVFRYTSAGVSTRDTFPFQIRLDGDPNRASAWTAGDDGRFYGVANYGQDGTNAILFAFIP
ncbi:MAG: choice-of-anchor tandem repeat GloVer-containing protein [Polyangiales bacterium]